MVLILGYWGYKHWLCRGYCRGNIGCDEISAKTIVPSAIKIFVFKIRKQGTREIAFESRICKPLHVHVSADTVSSSEKIVWFRWGETPLHAPPCQAPGNTHVEWAFLWLLQADLSVTLINQQWLRSNKISGFCDIMQWKNSCLRHWGIMCRLHYGCNFNLLTTIIFHQISIGVHIHLIVMLCFYRYVLKES